ncbi:MAG: AMP-binding protein [Deltaproteobacteria bacterium]|nr:AMP-binding protein [Deltaproteobacteria bacterium]
MQAFKEITIGGVLRETAGRYPDNDALIYPDRDLRLNYREFEARCAQVAKGFMAIGVLKGDHVSVWTTNLPEWLYMQFGLGMIGAVLVTINTNYKSHDLKYIVGQSDSTTLVLMEGYRDTNYFETVQAVAPELAGSAPGKLESAALPFLKNVIYIGKRPQTPGMFTFEDLIRLGEAVTDEELADREGSLSVHDAINMQYTSGTTGFPKGVMLTHYNIANNAYMLAEVMGMTPSDRLLIQVPFFHCFGCVLSTMNAVCSGSAMVVMEFFDPAKSLAAIDREKCTAVNGVPTMFIAMLNHPDFDRHDVSSLRTGIMAGAPCPVEVMNQVRTRMHCPEIVIAFGQTECSPVMTMTRRDDDVELRVATVGRLLDNIEGKVVDPETGADLPPNTQGEIVTRSACVMKGYYKMPEETAKAVDAEGWLHTGDLGTVDERGYFRITGRIKDMIIRGGENIYPREIEEFLLGHPKVSDVQVVGIPDKKYGEQVLAAIQLKADATATEEEFTAYCRDRIARHKIPKYWEFVKEYPLTASGKVQKFKMREQFSKLYGQKAAA